MSKEITVIESGAMDFTNAEMIQTLKETVAKGTTDSEFKMFTEMCKGTGLNPFKREIWCIVIPEDKQKGRRREVQIMTGINGFYEIATSDATFDGIEHGFVAPDGSFQPSSYPKPDYIGAWARVHIKNRRFPQEQVALRSEFAKSYGNWKIMPRLMLEKCADALALRKAFPQKLGGINEPAEVEDLDQAELASIAPRSRLRTADQLAADPVKQAMGNDDFSPSAVVVPVAEKAKPQGIFRYDLKSYFLEMDLDKANKIARKLEKMQGVDHGDDLWEIPEYVEGLKDYLLSDTAEGVAA